MQFLWVVVLFGCSMQTTSRIEIPTELHPETSRLPDDLPELGADQPDFLSWEQQRAQRQDQLGDYLAQHQTELDWFLHWPFGKGGGIPLGVFWLWPTIYPSIWRQPDWYEEVGLPAHPKDFEVFQGYGPQQMRDGLPLGLIRAQGPIAGPFKVAETYLNVAGQTCASCHVGRVQDDTGGIHFLIGAPNTTWDPFLFKEKIHKTVQDKHFLEKENYNFTDAKLAEIGIADWQVQVYKVAWFTPLLITTILEQLKQTMTEPNYLDDRVYRSRVTKDTRMFGGMPGHVDITSPIIGSQSGVLNSIKDHQKKEALLAAMLPEAPVIVDFMSVWLQKRQHAGQWDGNTPDPLLRNLGAEVAGIMDPSKVDFENAVLTTKLLSALPPPPYLFEVDMKKASRGKAIFEHTCLKCHQGNQFIALATIKTDPNRAVGLKPLARKALAKLLAEACLDKTHPSCKIKPSEIIIDRSKNPGYMAPFLDGIWARAPYLHNGSVPTLYHMLVPDERPKTFWRGNLTYDKDKVGFTWDRPTRQRVSQASPQKTPRVYAKLYDTSLSGYSNQGHGSIAKDRKLFFGNYDFKKDTRSRDDLLEYLKTL